MGYHLETGRFPSELSRNPAMAAMSDQDLYLFNPFLEGNHDLRSGFYLPPSSLEVTRQETTRNDIEEGCSISPSFSYRNYHYEHPISPTKPGYEGQDLGRLPSTSRQVNVAGLGAGARRVVEKSRRIAQAAQQRGWEVQQQQEEENKRIWKEEQARRQAYEQQRAQQEEQELEWRRQQYEAEVHRRREEQAEEARRIEQQRAQEWYQHHQQTGLEQASEPNNGFDGREVDVKIAAQGWYQAEDRPQAVPLTNAQYYAAQDYTDAEGESRDELAQLPIQPSNGKVPHHATNGTARDSCSSMTSQSLLAYDMPSPPSSPTQENSPVFRGLALADDAPTRRSRLDSIQAFSVAATSADAQRETIYEDDFEEEALGNLSRYTHYGGVADSSPSLGGSAWSGARKSLFRATTYQPVPMARCADCRQELNLEELASHICNRSPETSTPTFDASPLSPLSPLAMPSMEGGPQQTVTASSSSSSSRFMEKYNALEATPRKKSLFNAASSNTYSPRSTSIDDHMRSLRRDEVAKEELLRSTSSPAASPLCSSLSDFEVGVAAERRRQIGLQRAAKQALSPRLPDSGNNFSSFPSPSSHLSLSSARPIPTRSKSDIGAGSQDSALDRRLQRDKSIPDRILSCTSTSSAASSGRASSLFIPNSPAVAVTPSSSFEDAAGPGSRSNDRAKGSAGLLSPDMAISVTGWSRLQPEERKTPKRRGPAPAPLDLSEIENMMNDLKMRGGSDQAGSHSAPVSLEEKPVRRGGGQPPGHAHDNLGGKSSLKAARTHEGRHKGNFTSVANSGASSSFPSSTSRYQARANRKCCICKCPLSSSSSTNNRSTPTPARVKFVEMDGRYFCAEDYRQRYLPKCVSCQLPVEKGGVKSSDGALRGVYHRGCFRCLACHARFEDGVFYVWKGAPYCFQDYSRLAGTVCGECDKGIAGECRQILAAPTIEGNEAGPSSQDSSIGGTSTINGSSNTHGGKDRNNVAPERFHVACFTCQYRYPSSSRHKGDEDEVQGRGKGKRCTVQLDEFWQLEDGRRFCEEHALALLNTTFDNNNTNTKESRGGDVDGRAPSSSKSSTGARTTGAAGGTTMRAQKRCTMLKALA